MPVSVYWPASTALERRLKSLDDAAKGRGVSTGWVKNDLRIIVESDNEDKLMRGVDRYGRPRAALAQSTLKQPRANPQSLIPHGFASRFIACFETEWVDSYLVMRWVGVVDKKGRSFVQYHLTGASRPGTRWVLPARDVSGITPKGWRKVADRWREFARDVLGGAT